jgi:hypothetical protein
MFCCSQTLNGPILDSTINMITVCCCTFVKGLLNVHFYFVFAKFVSDNNIKISDRRSVS